MKNISRPVEINQTFESLDAWIKWSSLNKEVLNRAEADKVARRILASGFIEPLTRMEVSPKDIDANTENWREGLLARGINSRMRAVLAIIDEKIGDRQRDDVRIFGAEALSHFALLLRGRFARFVGSEYGMDENSKHDLFPIQHQDLTALTFPSNSFDLAISNEVLEHVSDLDAALREFARILKPEGWHVGTHPFRFMSKDSDLRTKLVEGIVIHLKEAQFHGNPIDPGHGSLVFEIPGWDIVERARAAGFKDPHMRFVASEKHGYISENIGIFVLCAQK